MKLWIAVPAAFALLASPAWAQHQHDHEPAEQAEPDPHEHHDTQEEPGEEILLTRGHLDADGTYHDEQWTRDASGTAWQPIVTQHDGVHRAVGDWTVMSHVLLNGVYAWSDGPRGDEDSFLAGMVMASAERHIGSGRLRFRAMLSPDPLMGAEGYPLLFAAGETADGVETLVDRQHPHDLFMELSATYTHFLGGGRRAFIYAGLPGEPAFGPPSFMHRLSAMDSPEAPISHHWFDSTHITFGVLTAGYIHGDWKIEASQFRGREPDEHRYDIETGELDSTALRLSWNPNDNLALQASWADIESPEALHPEEDEERWSVSGIYTRRIGDHGWWSTTLAFSNKERTDGVSIDAWLAETAWHPNDRWTVFARGEAIETDELGGHHGPVESVQRLSLGAIRDFRINETVTFGVGALVQQHFASDALEPSYGGDQDGGMAFVRLRIG